MNKKNKQDFYIKFFICFGIVLVAVISFIPLKYIKSLNIFSENSLFTTIETKTFDLRQKYLAKFRQPSDKIIVISVDNHSYEYMTKHFGYWPMPRSVYVDMINYVEAQKPKAFGIDIQFVGEWLNKPQDDINLADTISKYKNVTTGLFFDDAPKEKRTPVNVPDKHASKLTILSDNFEPYYAKNFRASYPLMLEKGNLSSINLYDTYDGIQRAIPMFVKYPVFDENGEIISENYFQNLSIRLLSSYFNTDDKHYTIDKNNNLLINNQKIPMQPHGEVILNWYNKKISNIDNNYNSFFQNVPFKDLFIDMENVKEGRPQILPPDLFKDKIVVMGFTADSLFDLKATPVEKYLPGVELYGIFISNFFDNSFIKRVNEQNVLILSLSLFLLLFTIFYKSKFSIINLITLGTVIILYIIASYAIMFFNHIWLPVVMPIVMIILSYLTALVLKYFVKSRDYDSLYKLVNTDELTGLYNKRFFSKHMEMNIEYSQIYKQPFSLIMIDIDFFKKFNDTYGHLSGDCVLKQTAQYLQEETSTKGVVCRYGGEEMCIIMPNTKFNDAKEHAQRLCDKIAKSDYILANGEKTHVTISLGVCEYSNIFSTATKMIEQADKGLYYAKEHGRNQVGISD